MNRFFFPLFLIVLAGVVFFQFTDPLWAEIGELQTEQARLKEGLANAQKLREVQQGLIETYNSFSAQDLERLNKFLPDNVDNVRLIIDINNIARRYGMSIRNIGFSTDTGAAPRDAAPSPAGTLQRGSMVMSLTTSGSYLNFQAFLVDLAKSLRLLEVVSAGFTSADKDTYDYSVELQTYWLQ